MSSTSTRTFEFKDDKSSKFWEVTQFGSTVIVRYGKTGTNGQTQEKVFDDASAASKHVAKLITEKTGKGYLEVGSAPSAGIEKSVPSDEGRATEGVAKPPTKTKAPKLANAKPAKPKNPTQDPEASPESLLVLLDKDDKTNRLLARHPRASADLLEKLSHSSDEATRRNVASNPNTLPETLIKLGQQFPKEFLANPALDLLLMIQPTLMEEVPQALLIRILKQDDCPTSLLTWAASHPQANVQLAVAMNANAPEAAVDKLRSSQHVSVQEAVSEPQGSSDPAKDPEKAFEQAIKDRLRSMSISDLQSAWMASDIGLAQWPHLPMAFRLQKASDGMPDWDAVMSKLVNTTWTAETILQLLGYEAIGRCIVRHPSTPMAVREAVLETLAKDSNQWVRRIAAENSSTPLRALEVLAKDKDTFVRSGVAANPSTSGAVLAALTKDQDEYVLSGVVRNPSTSLEVKKMLANNKEHFVRSSIAENPTTPVALLEVLAKDKNNEVRINVAKNSSTPVSILEVLARDSSNDVRRNVLQQQSVPVSILETLAKDTDSSLRSSVAKHTFTPVVILEVLANDNDSAVRRSVAKNPSAPSAVLQSLAQDKDFWIRDDVAEKPYTSGAGLAILATDALEMVRKSVAANASAPVAVLESLAKDDDSYVRRSVASNLSTPEALLASLAQDVHSEVRRNVAMNPKTSAAVLRALAKDKDSGVRNAIAENSHTPSDVLERLATDKNAGVLIGVAENPNTPALAQLRLCDSKFESVREALAGQAHNSAELCQALLKDSSEVVRQAVMRNKELDQATLDELAIGIEREKDALALLEHPNLGARSAQIIADKLFTMAPTDSLWYRNELSKASPEVQAAVKEHKVLNYPGKDPNKALLEKRPLAPVMALCAGPFVDSTRIVKMASSTDWLVRAAVARNAGTPPNLLKKLSNDPHTLVSALVASRNADKAETTSNNGVSDANPSTFNLSRVVEEILRRMRADGQAWACVPLVNSKNWRNHANINEFLSWLKRHEFFDDVIELFIRDLDDSNRDFFWQLVPQLKDGEVRMRLVKNVEVPVETLEKFLLCEFVDVLLVIANRPDVSADLRSKAEKTTIRLLTKKGSSYRQTIAKNHVYLTVAIRERLAKDKDFWVKREIENAQNSPYPDWIYQTEVLGCDDEDPLLEVGEIGQQLAVRFGVERDIRKQQLAYWLDQLRAVFDREIRIHKAENVLTTNQLTPSDVSNAMIWLGYVPASDKVTPTKSARSTDWLTRLGAALHLGASQAILKLLTDDVDPDVAQAVKWREVAVGEFPALHVKPSTT